MKPGRCSIALLVLIGVIPTLGFAQAPDDDGASLAPTVESVLGDLRPGTPIRLSVMGGSASGSFVRRVADGLVLTNPATKTETLIAERIDSIWVHRSSTGRGARIGAMIGGVLLGMWTVAFAEEDCDFTCAAPFAGGIGLVGAGAGALVGAGVGSQIRSWRLVYP